jgi:uncharacterized protein
VNEYKILFTGTMGAGKTTAIAAISEVPPVKTDVANTDLSVNKANTTVGLDFGQVTLDSGDRLRLFGTPGQSRFDFMWKILVKNALGLIILTDNSRPDPVADLDVYLDGFADDLDDIPCVVGVGRTETHPHPPIDAYGELLDRKRRVIPIVKVDVRQPPDVLMLIDILLAQIEARNIGEMA